MPKRHRLASLNFDAMFLSLIAVNVVLAAPFAASDSSSKWYLYIPLWSMTQAVAVLLAAWMALGGRGRPWRIVIGFLFLFAAAWCTTAVGWHTAEWTSRFAFFTTFHAMLLFLVIHFFKWRIHKTDGDDLSDLTAESIRLARSADTEEPVAARPKHQFTLADMLSWMTALAVVLGTSRGLPPISSDRFDGFAIQDALPLLGMALFAPVIVWTALGVRPGSARAAVLVVMGFMLMAACYGAFLFVPAVLWTFSMLSIARAAGYRFLCNRPTYAPAPPRENESHAQSR
ncbi:MAG TPA: hypothetical protein VJL29_07950 [Thermoguttaceae bacterium]|nr:hypothetical protein [Thermoguttaceae bacterium]